MPLATETSPLLTTWQTQACPAASDDKQIEASNARSILSVKSLSMWFSCRSGERGSVVFSRSLRPRNLDSRGGQKTCDHQRTCDLLEASPDLPNVQTKRPRGGLDGPRLTPLSPDLLFSQ